MQNRKTGLVIILLFAGVVLHAQQLSQTVIDYIAKYKELAIAEMQRTGVPASITLAQGIHETEAGTSELVLKSNNHFGIKCKTGWNGPSVSHDDDARGECFRKYDSAQLSYRDHSDFLKNGNRYAFLFQLDPLDYEGWAYGLKKAGYATNPKYSKILIKLIEDYHLQDYTLIALGEKNASDEPVFVKNNNADTDAAITQAVVKERPAIQKPVVDYPTGQFTINNTKVIWVEAGTSFLAIANQYDIPLQRLFDFNDMTAKDIAEEGQLVFLQRKRKIGDHITHTFTNGEDLWSVSQTEGIRLESLLEYNMLQKNMLPDDGEVLNLASKADKMPRLFDFRKKINTAPVKNDVAVSNNVVTHTVTEKETVYSISRKYGVSAADIISWNNLSNTDLKVGQSLKIYK